MIIATGVIPPSGGLHDHFLWDVNTLRRILCHAKPIESTWILLYFEDSARNQRRSLSRLQFRLEPDTYGTFLVEALTSRRALIRTLSLFYLEARTVVSPSTLHIDLTFVRSGRLGDPDVEQTSRPPAHRRLLIVLSGPKAFVRAPLWIA